MTILTIDEAAGLLRITKRTLYRLRQVPRVRIGHRVMYLKKDLEAWVRAQREGDETQQNVSLPAVDHPEPTVYHRNALFILPRSR
jgi:excisionase family DNA binding protein